VANSTGEIELEIGFAGHLSVSAIANGYSCENNHQDCRDRSTNESGPTIGSGYGESARAGLLAS
jgi:hypothetical protein